IGNHMYLATIGSGRNYAFGTGGALYNGFSPNAPSNPDLQWEETAQTNIGFEATLLQNFSLTFDWYKKVTDGLLMNPRIPAYVGAIGNPAANVGSMENSGIEVELGYRKNIGNLNFSLSGNASYMQNKVTHLGDGIDFLSGGQTFQASSHPITRTAVGQPINSFYGFERLGIFQTQEEVLGHVNSQGQVIQPNARPGDFIWADRDDDGEITEN